MEFLSDIELYFSGSFHQNNIIITGDEFKHITRVMRHRNNDELYVTDGKGNIYHGKISEIDKEKISLSIISQKTYPNRFSNIFFCLPVIKNVDRLEYAIEKCIELGINQFIIFKSERTLRSSINLSRLNKIACAAMKQSLQANLPVITIVESFSDLSGTDQNLVLLEQKSDIKLERIVIDKTKKYYFLFGPEGGFSEKEIQNLKDVQTFSLCRNRLRTDTAAISCASVIQTII